MFLVVALCAQGQRAGGELRIEVHDPKGAVLAPSVDLVSDINQFRKRFQVGSEGVYVVRDLPFGVYRLILNAEGFATWTKLVEVRSEVPIHLSVTMGLARVATQIDVNDSSTLVDPSRTGTRYSIGGQALRENTTGQPGRGISDRVNDLPGWLAEANGVLHPRGSEYDVQYVVDGLPITENRSLTFAPELHADDVQSMRVLTANYPAEYGRKLGGIVEVTTEKNVPAGLHGELDVEGGSFETSSGFAGLSYSRGKNRASISGDGFLTDRYLDPPVLANYTNHATAGGFTASYESDFSARDRLRIGLAHHAVHFQVPNELVQQEAGQRQNRAAIETDGQVYFQHAITSDLLLSLSGSVRDAGAVLSSNEIATPVIVSQDRGYREGYVRWDLAGHHGRHDWKAGADSIVNRVREELAYSITDPTQFAPGTQSPFAFSDRRWDVEPAAFVQDQVRLGNWNVDAGLRFDRYGLVVRESAWSPRVGVSRYVSSLNLVVHAAYDRVFQTPALENLLLASSPQLSSINPVVIRLPVRPAHANYYEGGLTKAFAGKLRVDANLFRRDFLNYSDDDVLLDTGVNFPIAFAKARIIGEEVRVEVPHWGRFSGYLSYANQSGIGNGPITGGLFLGSAVASGLTETSKFAVSQDQRNTAHARLSYQAPHQIWFAVGLQFGSGLPADINGENPGFLLTQYGPAILDRVNLESGRVRPNLSSDAAAGVELYRKEQRSAAFQIQVTNLADRVNVINFASLFSGTAVAAARSFSAKVRVTF